MDEEDLRPALRAKEFQLVYQPKVNCATGELAGF
jgi:EAL domain-containing protein (putative c-di-GMP-specific phosphodiesterase class I)